MSYMTRTEITSRPIPTVRQAAGNPLLVTLAKAAKAVERSGEILFVFPTYGQWNIGPEAPTTGSYYEMTPTARFKVEA
jgi:hypothetical protein